MKTISQTLENDDYVMKQSITYPDYAPTRKKLTKIQLKPLPNLLKPLHERLYGKKDE